MDAPKLYLTSHTATEKFLLTCRNYSAADAAAASGTRATRGQARKAAQFAAENEENLTAAEITILENDGCVMSPKRSAVRVGRNLITVAMYLIIRIFC